MRGRRATRRVLEFAATTVVLGAGGHATAAPGEFLHVGPQCPYEGFPSIYVMVFGDIPQPNGGVLHPLNATWPAWSEAGQPFVTGHDRHAPDFVHRPGTDTWFVYYSHRAEADVERTLRMSETLTSRVEQGLDPNLDGVQIAEPAGDLWVGGWVDDPSVVLTDTAWYMAYTAGWPHEGIETLHYATSFNGQAWSPATAAPAESTIALAMPSTLSLSAADVARTGRPSLVWDGCANRFLLYFDARACVELLGCETRSLVAVALSKPSPPDPWMFEVLGVIEQSPAGVLPEFFDVDVELINGHYEAVSADRDNIYRWSSGDGLVWDPGAKRSALWRHDPTVATYPEFVPERLGAPALMTKPALSNDQIVGAGFDVESNWPTMGDGRHIWAGYFQQRAEARDCADGTWHSSSWGASASQPGPAPDDTPFPGTGALFTEGNTFCEIRVVNPLTGVVLAHATTADFPDYLPSCEGTFWFLVRHEAEFDSDGDGVPMALDCNDNDATIYPGALEICADCVDQDCSGADAPADDCVDPCPDDPLGDWDHDGVCGSEDNCETIENPGQENCNLESEFVHSPGLVLGDACDPVPCPQNIADPTYVSEWTVHKHLMGGDYFAECGTTYADELRLYTLQSHPLSWAYSPSQPVHDVPTHARFCVPKPQLNITCTDEDDIRDALLNTEKCGPDAGGTFPAGCAAPDHEAFEDRYYRMTFTAGGNGVDPNGEPKVLDYEYEAGHSGSTPVASGNRWTWNYSSDFGRWRDANLLPDEVEGVGSLYGTRWLHAGTLVGSEDVPGFHTGIHGEQLANHYELDIAPQTLDCQDWNTIAWTPRMFFLWQTLPDPPPDAFRRFDALRGEANILVELEGNDWGAIDARGNAEIVTERLGAALSARLADDALVWANAVEPYAHQGRGAAFPMAMALSSVGPEIVDLVSTDGVMLYSQNDLAMCGYESPFCAVCPSGRCGGAGACCMLTCASDEDCPSGHCTFEAVPPFCAWPAPTGSPYAVDYVPVLTRVGGGLFVVGGSDPVTDRPTGEIWFAEIGSDSWSYVPAWLRPENVIAASYSFATDELFVLDETPSGLARLWAVQVRSAATRMLGTWPRHAAWNQHWLVVDRDGALLLASSKDAANAPPKGGKKQEHAIARIDVRVRFELRVDGIERGNRALVLPPVVDASGYTLVLAKSTGKCQGAGAKCVIDRERKNVLALEPAAAAELGSQL